MPKNHITIVNKTDREIRVSVTNYNGAAAARADNTVPEVNVNDSEAIRVSGLARRAFAQAVAGADVARGGADENNISEYIKIPSDEAKVWKRGWGLGMINTLVDETVYIWKGNEHDTNLEVKFAKPNTAIAIT